MWHSQVIRVCIHVKKKKNHIILLFYVFKQIILLIFFKQGIKAIIDRHKYMPLPYKNTYYNIIHLLFIHLYI